MKQHRYRITVEHLALPDGSAPPDATPLVFEAGNHDDILSIARRMQQRSDLPAADTLPLAVGLKLFSEVLLAHRTAPLFAGLAPHFRDFMQQLKGGARAAGGAS